MTELSEYQVEMLERLHTAWRRNRCVMLQMPTGTGKTVLLAAVIRGFISGLTSNPSPKG